VATKKTDALFVYSETVCTFVTGINEKETVFISRETVDDKYRLVVALTMYRIVSSLSPSLPLRRWNRIIGKKACRTHDRPFFR
jgi:hypothetical protein